MTTYSQFFDEVYLQAKNTKKSFIESIKYVPRYGFSSMPNSLFKFYRPTASNILDIFNGQLYLSSTSSFNDIFDSTIGGNKDIYIKSRMLSELKKHLGKVDYISKEMYDDLLKRSSKDNRWDDSFFEKLGFYFSLGNKGWQEIHKLIERMQCDFDEIIKKANEEYCRVSCFIGSDGGAEKIINNAAMWGHYAENNTGFCVEFDTERIRNFDFITIGTDCSKIMEKLFLEELSKSFFEVIYDNKRPSMTLSLMKKIRKGKGCLELEKLFFMTCTTKSRSWSKEHEYRLILHKDSKYLVNSKIDFPFIKTIYIGARMDKSLRSSIFEFAERKKISIEVMKPCANKYELEHDIGYLIERQQEKGKRVFRDVGIDAEIATGVDIKQHLDEQIQGLNGATDTAFKNFHIHNINMFYDKDLIAERIIHDESKMYYKLQGCEKYIFCWTCWNNWNQVTILQEINSRYSYDKEVKFKCTKCINQIKSSELEEQYNG